MHADERDRLDIRDTGEDTAPLNDVADPHPSDEEHPYRERHPGGAATPDDTAAVNDKTHTGKAPPRPKNAETER